MKDLKEFIKESRVDESKIDYYELRNNAERIFLDWIHRADDKRQQIKNIELLIDGDDDDMEKDFMIDELAEMGYDRDELYNDKKCMDMIIAAAKNALDKA